MTVSSETNARVQYNGNASTTVFSVPFVFSTSADLDVYITVVATGVETLKTLTTHYTVSGGGGTSAPATGSVTFLSAPASGERITILRSLANTQSVDYVENAAFPAQSHELALDRLTLQVQDLKENLSRAIVFTAGSTSTDISVASPVAGSVLVWDDTASIIETADLDTVSAPLTLSSTGLLSCTSLTPRTYSGRTLTGTANQVTVTNGDGVSGNPTLSLPSSIIGSGSIESTTTTTVGTNLIVKGANELRLNNSDNTHYTGFKAPALSANKIYTLPTGDGTSGQLLSTNGSGTLSWATAATPTSDFVKISSTTTSGVGTVDFTSLDFTTYSHYKLVIEELKWDAASSSGFCYIRLSTGGSFVTASTYHARNVGVIGSGAVNGAVQTATAFIATHNQVNNQYQALSGEILIFGSDSGGATFQGFRPIVQGTMTLTTVNSSDANSIRSIGSFAGYSRDITALDGIRLYTSSGSNFDNGGVLTLYGIKR